MSLSPADAVWLMQVAGAATLTLRGSFKATTGKLLEKAIARAALTALGMRESSDFWLNVGADAEVEREIDAEILTRRGRVRMDIALIGRGNQEVSDDKLNRVGRNGVLLVDKLGPNSQVPRNAAARQIYLVQIQDHLPLSELYQHLNPLVPEGVHLVEPPASEREIAELLSRLPDETFRLPVSTGTAPVGSAVESGASRSRHPSPGTRRGRPRAT